MLILFAKQTIVIMADYMCQKIGRFIVKYLSIKQTATRWGISERRIQVLCKEGRIPGTITIGRTWGIPDNAAKPADARIKSGRYIKQK